VQAFFSKVEIHSLFVAGFSLHSKPTPGFRPDSDSFRWMFLGMGTGDLSKQSSAILCYISG
jgi:hypothetical protein